MKERSLDVGSTCLMIFFLSIPGWNEDGETGEKKYRNGNLL